MTKPNGNYL